MGRWVKGRSPVIWRALVCDEGTFHIVWAINMISWDEMFLVACEHGEITVDQSQPFCLIKDIELKYQDCIYRGQKENIYTCFVLFKQFLKCVYLMNIYWRRKGVIQSLWLYILTLVGASSRTILALVMMPNCPRPPRTAKNSSEFISLEQVRKSPLPA